MVSFNHYAYGTVGDFFYRRILGIEETQAGYKTFSIKPVIGGGLTSANGSLKTKYGLIESKWTVNSNNFAIEVTVPINTQCEVTLPDGTKNNVGSGKYNFNCKIKEAIK